MSKLDEIGARVTAPAGWADKMRQQDCKLLIRAVRQLGRYAPKGKEYPWAGEIDPDVLELLE